MTITNTGWSKPITTSAASNDSGDAYLVRKKPANEITVSRINSQNLRDFNKLPIFLSPVSCDLTAKSRRVQIAHVGPNQLVLQGIQLVLLRKLYHLSRLSHSLERPLPEELLITIGAFGILQV